MSLFDYPLVSSSFKKSLFDYEGPHIKASLRIPPTYAPGNIDRFLLRSRSTSFAIAETRPPGNAVAVGDV